MAATSPVPAMVIRLPDGDPGPLVVERLRERVGGGAGANAKAWLVEMAAQALPGKTLARSAAAARAVAR
jgi:hypothetical protein